MPLGVINIAHIANLYRSYGIENVFVGQDNAHVFGDVFAQMKSSFNHLDSIVHI